jgi:hypothetical protein
MFLALKWPTGWSTSELLQLGAWIACVAGLLLAPLTIVTVTGRVGKVVVGIGLLVAVCAFVLGLVFGWAAPMSLHPSKPRTSAMAASVAFGFCVLAVLIVALLLYNARRAGEVRWTVTDPRDQGAAVAGYLATYLLPLLSVGTGGWRLSVAYGIYLVTLYVVYVRSDSLVLVNPTLYLFRYRIYDVVVDAREPADRRRVLLLTKLQITRSREVDVVPLGDRSYIATEVKD